MLLEVLQTETAVHQEAQPIPALTGDRCNTHQMLSPAAATSFPFLLPLRHHCCHSSPGAGREHARLVPGWLPLC